MKSAGMLNWLLLVFGCITLEDAEEKVVLVADGLKGWLRSHGYIGTSVSEVLGVTPKELGVDDAGLARGLRSQG